MNWFQEFIVIHVTYLKESFRWNMATVETVINDFVRQARLFQLALSYLVKDAVVRILTGEVIVYTFWHFVLSSFSHDHPALIAPTFVATKIPTMCMWFWNSSPLFLTDAAMTSIPY